VLQGSNDIKNNIMTTIKNTLSKLDLITVIGLTFVSLFIVPTVVFLIQEIINGSFNNW